MTTMIVQTPPTTIPKMVAEAETFAKMRIAVHIDTEVLHPEVARRKANVWLLMYVGNLLGAENPELTLKGQLWWRMDVVLTSPKRGHIGTVGKLYVDALSGEVEASETLSEELQNNADALVAH
jgi:hypothetical protein